MQVKMLGVRPFPGPDESLPGYSLRLASVNGLHSLEFLLTTLGLERGAHKRLVKAASDAVATVVEHLALRLGRPAAQLHETFASQLAYATHFDEKRVIKQLGVAFPRLCPFCVAETGMLDWRWGLAVIGKCHLHRTPLVDTCPACLKPLEWKTELLTGCARCSYQWSSHPREASAGRLTPQEVNIWQIVSGKASDEFQTRDVAAAIVSMARPLDSWIDSVYSIPHTPRYSDIVDRAYRLLSGEPSLVEDWSQTCVEVRKELSSIGPEAALLPMRNLRAKLHDSTPIAGGQQREVLGHSGVESFNEHIAFIGTVRRKLASVDETDIRFHVSFNEIAEVLCLPSSEVQFLTIDGPLQPINSTSKLDSQIFDLRQLASIMRRCTGGTNPLQPTRVTPGDPRLIEHFTRYGKLVAAVLTGAVQGKFEPEVGLLEVAVETSELGAWLIEQRHTACQEPLAINRVMAAMRCGEKRIRDLVQAGHFHWARWATAGGRDRVDGPSLLAYLTADQAPA